LTLRATAETPKRVSREQIIDHVFRQGISLILTPPAGYLFAGLAYKL